MARLTWAVICRSSSIDKDRNVASLLEIIEEIAVGTLPEDALKTGPIRLAGSGGNAAELVSLWWREDLDIPETVDARFRLLDPTGKELNTQEFSIDLSADYKRMRHRLYFPALLYNGPGVYLYTLQQRSHRKGGKWTTVAKVPLEMTVDAAKTDE